MRIVRVDKNREAEVPTNWGEAEAMITHALGPYYVDDQDRRRLSSPFAVTRRLGSFHRLATFDSTERPLAFSSA